MEGMLRVRWGRRWSALSRRALAPPSQILLACPPLQVPAALMVALFAGFGLPAYQGSRLAAAAAMLWASAPASLCLTYLAQAAFQACVLFCMVFATPGVQPYSRISDCFPPLAEPSGTRHSRQQCQQGLHGLHAAPRSYPCAPKPRHARHPPSLTPAPNPRPLSRMRCAR